MGEVSWDGKTILVIEDSGEVAEALADCYQKIGLRVLDIAVNGVDGTEKAKYHQPEIISLDIIMPVMDGIEAIHYFQKPGFLGFHPRIFIVSALCVDLSARESFTKYVPLTQLIEKPVDYSKILHAFSASYGKSPESSVLRSDALEDAVDSEVP